PTPLPSPASIPRRALLQTLGGGLGVLGAAPFFADPAIAGAASSAVHFAPRAKRVIHLFMNGGPFQADLFDPKPDLAKYAGQRPEGADLLTERPTGGLLPSPITLSPHGESRVPVSELPPNRGRHIAHTC